MKINWKLIKVILLAIFYIACTVFAIWYGILKIKVLIHLLSM